MAYYYLGVDGGGTKTEALLVDVQGHIVGRGVRGPSNPYFVDKESAMLSVAEAIAEAKARVAGRVVLRRALICGGNLRLHFDESTVATRLGIPRDSMRITGDHMNAFYAATGGSPGVVVLAGTGSFAIGVDAKRKRLILGGWGPLLGDEGSGYYIGVCALKAVIRAYEGRGQKTLLTPLVKDYYSIDDVFGLRMAVYGKCSNRGDISAISPLVLKAAHAGDEVALGIVQGAGRCLADLAKAVIRELEMDRSEYSVALIGGISSYGDLIYTPFRGEIRKEYRNIAVKEPRFVPAVGAIIIAMKEDGLAATDDVLVNLGRTYDQFVQGI